MRPRPSLWGALLVALFCALALRAAATAAEVLSLAEYRAELVTIQAQLTNADPDHLRAHLLSAHARLTRIARVELPDGSQSAATSFLGDLVASRQEADPVARRDLALMRLQTALAQVDAIPHDDTAARLARLDAILARPEFNAPVNWFDRVLAWLENWLRRLFPTQRTTDAAPLVDTLATGLAWGITIAAGVALTWLILYWAQRLAARFVPDVQAAAAGLDDHPLSAAQARQQAAAAAQAGAYRDAVRRLYLAALLHLDEQRLIPYDRSLTNREVLARVPTDAAIRPHLEPVVATFDRVWYGVREPDQQTFAQYTQAIDALETAARRAPRPETP